MNRAGLARHCVRRQEVGRVRRVDVPGEDDGGLGVTDRASSGIGRASRYAQSPTRTPAAGRTRRRRTTPAERRRSAGPWPVRSGGLRPALRARPRAGPQVVPARHAEPDGDPLAANETADRQQGQRGKQDGDGGPGGDERLDVGRARPRRRVAIPHGSDQACRRRHMAADATRRAARAGDRSATTRRRAARAPQGDLCRGDARKGGASGTRTVAPGPVSGSALRSATLGRPSESCRLASAGTRTPAHAREARKTAWHLFHKSLITNGPPSVPSGAPTWHARSRRGRLTSRSGTRRRGVGVGTAELRSGVCRRQTLAGRTVRLVSPLVAVPRVLVGCRRVSVRKSGGGRETISPRFTGRLLISGWPVRSGAERGNECAM